MIYYFLVLLVAVAAFRFFAAPFLNVATHITSSSEEKKQTDDSDVKENLSPLYAALIQAGAFSIPLKKRSPSCSLSPTPDSENQLAEYFASYQSEDKHIHVKKTLSENLYVESWSIEGKPFHFFYDVDIKSTDEQLQEVQFLVLHGLWCGNAHFYQPKLGTRFLAKPESCVGPHLDLLSVFQDIKVNKVTHTYSEPLDLERPQYKLKQICLEKTASGPIVFTQKMSINDEEITIQSTFTKRNA